MNGVGERLRRDPNVLVLGGAVALATIILGTAIAIYASANPERSTREVEAAAVAEDGRSSTTTTTAGSGDTTTSTTASGAGGTLPATGGGNGQSGVPATPRETADPAEEPVAAEPFPPGVLATLDVCTWSPANGGELQAAGTITWTGPEEDSWDVEVYWLHNDRELDWETNDNWIDLQPGQTAPWRLAVGGHPDPPADPFRCLVQIF
jgi:hypothetical protein